MNSVAASFRNWPFPESNLLAVKPASYLPTTRWQIGHSFLSRVMAEGYLSTRVYVRARQRCRFGV